MVQKFGGNQMRSAAHPIMVVQGFLPSTVWKQIKSLVSEFPPRWIAAFRAHDVWNTKFRWISFGAKKKLVLGKRKTTDWEKPSLVFKTSCSHENTTGQTGHRHIIESITSFTWSWAKKHFTNQGYILYGYMALYWYVHSIPFTNFLCTTKKQTFLHFWFGPSLSISPTWRYSPTCGEHGPTTA